MQRKERKSSTRRKSELMQEEKRKINKQAIVATVFFSAVFFFMAGYYAYFIITQSQTVVTNNYNKRIDNSANTVIRGTIFSSDGKRLAYTDTNETEDDLSDDTRKYPYGKSFAHAIGITTHGKYGLEKLYNFDLLSTQLNPMQKIIDDFANNTEKGCDVYTTFNAKLQKKAYEALGDNKGAVFAMDPKTGEILIKTSKPSYDPESIDEIWDELNEDSTDSRLVDRSFQGRYIPGSVFKIVTALEYIRENKDYKDFSYTCDGNAQFGGFKIDCFDGHSHGTENLEEAFAYSCNSAFSTIANDFNIKKFNNTSKDLLFNSKLPLEGDYNESNFPLDSESKEFDITQTGIGQGKTTVSPAHMAMIASSIANKGVLMRPFMVRSVENGNGSIVKQNKSKKYKKLMTKKEANQLKEYMKAVCEYGTARAMSGSSYDAYGKTGTAEIDKDNHINSWFVGFAEKGNKKIAIAVVLEDINQGGDNAVFAAKTVFDNFFD